MYNIYKSESNYYVVDEDARENILYKSKFGDPIENRSFEGALNYIHDQYRIKCVIIKGVVILFLVVALVVSLFALM